MPFDGLDISAGCSGRPGWDMGGTGHIDDLRIYHRLLTDAEVQQIYDAGRP